MIWYENHEIGKVLLILIIHSIFYKSTIFTLKFKLKVMKFKILILFLIVPIFCIQAQSRATTAKDYLSMPGPIALGQKE
ncbi:hypothetical protein EGY07_15275 [Chryseobacterium indologenes]|uniref:Uncharacterized protein n=1 Tax=Chryseobacterium indologenes TaxID=253 RepID=A0AAD0YYS0_CHRID|nr:hypothetical protein CRN76_02235 [Chryseobacterium indologenes]AYY86939.1 hypothetical protein EGX91_21525 [Chryseobacterium indologenes]AYZ36830.1 hypothetical protein EGY07_15275 [Chryseobacterium indologenes]AZB20033.1 hypothetical protein EG352_20905 [Chryseobacterium indologenes]